VRKKLALSLILFFLLISNSVSSTETEDVTFFRALGGVTEEEIPQDIEIKWERELGKGAIDSSPVVKDGRLVVRTSGIYDWEKGVFKEKPSLFCFELSSGKEIWKTEIERGAGWELSTPLIYKEKVIVASTSGWVSAYDFFSGKKLWEKELENSSHYLGITSSPVALASPQKDAILVAHGSGILYSLSVSDGNLIWQKKLNGTIYFTTPVVEGEKIYVGTDSGFFYCLEAEDGSEIWKLTLKGKVRTTPFVDGEHLYLATTTYQDQFTPTKGFLYHILLKGNDVPEIKWIRKKEPSASSVVGNGESVFFISGEYLVAVTEENETLWKYHVGEQVQSSLIYSKTSRILIFTTNSEEGKVYAVDEKGRRAWAKNVKPAAPLFATPLVANGYIVVCGDDGSVHVFKEKELNVNMSFPSFSSVVVLVIAVALGVWLKKKVW